MRRLFGKQKVVKAHSFLTAGIFGINVSTLHHKILTGVLSEGSTVDMLCLWGKCDAIAPYSSYSKTLHEWDQKYSNFTVWTLDRNGHEVLYEDSAVVSSHVLPFLN